MLLSAIYHFFTNTTIGETKTIFIYVFHSLQVSRLCHFLKSSFPIASGRCSCIDLAFCFKVNIPVLVVCLFRFLLLKLLSLKIYGNWLFPDPHFQGGGKS